MHKPSEPIHRPAEPIHVPMPQLVGSARHPSRSPYSGTHSPGPSVELPGTAAPCYSTTGDAASRPDPPPKEVEGEGGSDPLQGPHRRAQELPLRGSRTWVVPGRSAATQHPRGRLAAPVTPPGPPTPSIPRRPRRWARVDTAARFLGERADERREKCPNSNFVRDEKEREWG